jgi:drug/metabolite transporter (DMT)-like permease
VLAVCLPVWGINWPLMKIAVGAIPPVWFACTRMASTCAFLFIVLGLLGKLRVPGRQDLPAILSVGVIMMGIYPALTMTGLVHAGAGRASLLSFITPLWVTPAAILLFGERLGALKAAGLIVGLLGLGVLFNPIGFDWGDRGVVRGNFILVLASMVWSITILHMRHHVWRLSPVELAPWQVLVATFIAAPLALWFDAGETVTWSLELIGLIAFAGPVATTLTVIGVIAIARPLPAITASLLFLAIPVAGMLCSAAVLGEPLTLTNVAGLGLIIIGLAFVTLGDAR